MIVDYRCDNENCENYNVLETRNIPMSETSNQVCEKCNEPMKRVWNNSVGIKTSDGYKK